MSLRLQPVRVATGCDDTDSQLVFADDLLVAVLVQLSDLHEQAGGMWFLEAGFGPVSGLNVPTFVDLNAAQTWISERLTTKQPGQ